MAGEWHEWDESLSVNERNYVDRKGNRTNTPLRVVQELRWIQKYPIDDKWILEKWMPSSFYGTESDWYKSRTPDGKWPLLGQYPNEGDYEDTGYAFPNEAVTEAILANAVGRIEHYVDSLPSTPEGRVRRAQYLAQMRHDKKEEILDKKHTEIIRETGWAFSGKTFSSGAGNKRQSDRDKTAERLGISLNNI
jgi:hypothetical protein